MPFDLVTNCGKRISILNDHSTTKSSTDSKSAPEVVKEASTPVVSSQQHTPVLVQASASASGPAPAPAPAPAHSPASAPAPAAAPAPAPALAHSHAHAPAPAPALAPASPIPMAYPHHAPVLPSAAQYYPVYYQPQPVYYYPPPPHPGAPNSAAAAYYRPGPPLQAPPGAGPAPTQVAAPAGYPQPAPAYQYAQGYASYAQVAPPQVASQPVKPAQAGPVVSRPVKKYTCHCMRSFTTSGHLARHMRIHTGEKNYVCPYDGCGARFSRQDNCMQHYRTHMGGRGRLNRKRQSSAGATNTQSGADSPASKKPNLGSTTNSHTESVPSDSPAPGIASSRSQSSSGFSGLSGHVAGTTTTTTTTLLAA